MSDLTKLELSILIDMLAIQTAEYTKMLREGTTIEEYNNCKNLINKLSAEIATRKMKSKSANKPGYDNNN